MNTLVPTTGLPEKYTSFEEDLDFCGYADDSQPMEGSGNVKSQAEIASTLEHIGNGNVTVSILLDLIKAALPKVKEQRNLSPLLPYLFRISPSKLFSLKDYAPFQDYYNLQMPDMSFLRTGRQCSKTTNMAFCGLAKAMLMPEYKQLIVAPLFEQTRRISSNYVKTGLHNALLRDLLWDRSCSDAVLQKTFKNGSTITFSYCYTDVERARGIPADDLRVDEIQDVNFDFLPILQETMSASKIGITGFSGTPKTMDNTAARIWHQSSQGEWVIPCGCGHWNIPAIEDDLLRMIGKDGLICSKCGKPINTRHGQWIHRFPNRKIPRKYDGKVEPSFISWHIPQPILPMHCEDPRAWSKLLAKISGPRSYRQQTLYNEVFAEDCDIGVKIITREMLQKASTLPFKNASKGAFTFINKSSYLMKAVGIDWGGRGELEDSLTAMSVIGLKSTGGIDVLHSEKFSPSVDDMEEAKIAAQMYRTFRCNAMGHDWRGVGQTKHTMLRQAGVPKLIAWANESTRVRYFVLLKRNATGVVYGSINRGAAVSLLQHEIQNNRFRFPQWEEEDSQNVFMDLNSWYGNYIARPDGADVYQVLRSAYQPDDIGWSVIYASLTCWLLARKWPDFAKTLTEGSVVQQDLRGGPLE